MHEEGSIVEVNNGLFVRSYVQRSAWFVHNTFSFFLRSDALLLQWIQMSLLLQASVNLLASLETNG